MLKLERNVIVIIFVLLFSGLPGDNVFASDGRDVIPFSEQNKKSLYKSISFGMSVDYTRSKSLVEYVETRLPNYSNLPPGQRLSKFGSGLGFFISGEFQITKSAGIKAEYNYYIKSVSHSSFPNHNYSYTSHLPIISANLIIPQEYSFIKIGAGAGYNFFEFTEKEFGIENEYTGNGITLRTEASLSLQMSNSLAVYLSGIISGTFGGELKNNNGDTLLNPVTGEEVTLGNFGAGLKLGLEIYIF